MTAESETREATMRAAVIAAPRELELRRVRRPEPGPGQLRVRLEGCGLCASNVPVWQGRPWFDYPMPPGAPGHEGWGVVDAAGPGVARVRIGDRVGLLSDAALAEYDLAGEDEVVVLPHELADRDVPAEPLACAINVFRRADIRRGHTVAIVGIGFLGAVVAELASRAGARVVAISRRRHALERARERGAEAAVSLEGDGDVAAEALRAAGAADGCDRVVEAVGVQRTLDLAAQLTRVRGRLVIAGFHQDGPRQVDLQSWNWRGIDVINAHERDPAIYVDGMREAVRALAADHIDPDPLYTRFPLADARAAFEALERRPDGFMKAVVTP